MQIPRTHTEQQVLDAIEHVVAVLAHRFKVPGFELDDVAQQARMMAVAGLANYDPAPNAEGRPTQPLENFLLVHVRFRLCNWRRKVYRRADTPCRSCHQGQPCGADGRVCKKYAVWAERQEAKGRVGRPLSMSVVTEQDEPHTWSASDAAEASEMLDLIDQHLDVELRATYLQMRAGKAVAKARRVAVEEQIREILGDTLEA